MNGKGRLKFNSISLILLVLLASILALAGYRHEPQANSTKRFFFPNSGGPVLFNHEKHSDQAEGCESCHHHLYSAEVYAECVECHDDDMIADDFTHAELREVEDHECGYCHEIHNEREPQSCRQCHTPTPHEPVIENTCINCHDFERGDEDWDEANIPHEEMLELHENDCSNCHQVQTISSAYHSQCVNCHDYESAKIFGKVAAEWDCQSCHLK